MSKANRFVAVFVLISLLAVGVFSVAAQNATPAVQPTTAGQTGQSNQANPGTSTGAVGSVQCSSDLVANLYVAERFFGFDQVRAQVATGQNAPTVVDLNLINKGQFTPWFSAPAVGSTLTQDQINEIANMMNMEAGSLQNQMNGRAGMDITSLASLTPATVANEAPECAQLRNELTKFFTVIAFENFTGANLSFGAQVQPQTQSQNQTQGQAVPSATPNG